MDEPYLVEVLHIVNPHLIFVESQAIQGEPVIQQVGIYGVLPVYKTIDIDGEIKAERCENWPIAANTLLRELFADLKNHVYFVPIHVDERSTIFDENIHQFGDIIIKQNTRISVTDHLVELTVAVLDEVTFHQKLSCGSLKLKLNTARTEEVLTAIEKYYKKQRKGNDWEKTIKKQTSLHQETKKITALTEENLKLLERSSKTDVKEIMKTIAQKEKDFNLCKDADLVSVGCGSRRTRSRLGSVTSKHGEDNQCRPQDIFTGLKRTLATHGKKKDKIDCSNSMAAVIHSTPKNVYETSANIKNNNPIDSDDEWDSIDVISNTKYSKEPNKNEVHQKYNSQCQEKSHRSPDKQCKSQEQQYGQYVQRNNDQNTPDNYQSTTNQHNIDIFEKSHNQNSSSYENNKDTRHGAIKKTTVPLKPKERRLVYCPDMEMSNTNLKNFVTKTVAENSAFNYGNTVEEEPNKTAFNSEDYNVCNKVDKGHHNRVENSNLYNKIVKENENDSYDIKVTAKVGTVNNTGLGLNASVLENKLLALKSVQKSDESNSISSTSDVSLNHKPILDSVKKTFETKSHAGSHDTKNTKSIPSKRLSSSTLQKKLQMLKDLKKSKDNSDSTSDTSVKDTSSSTEQSKTGPDELDQAKIKPEPLKIDVKPKLAEDKVVRNVNPFKNMDGSKSVFVDKLVTPILMVHTKNNNLIVPQCEIRDVPFNNDIKMMLKSMRIYKPKRLQTVTWTYILRGHSMFIIGPSSNGKTVGYVPAVCNLVLDSPSKLEGVGPICIIVCATALSVSEVESHCNRFLGVEERIVTFFPGINPQKTTTDLLNGCHVLICTAPALVNLLETDFGVDLRRLATVVLDDCERLSQVYTTELARIIRHVKVSLKNRADKALKVQYIVASRQWCDFMTPLAKKAPDSVIAIGASQECVLYSKTKTSVSFVKNKSNKVNSVVEFLEEIDRTKRTVIVCREDEEVIQLEKTLILRKHAVFSCNSTMDLHDLCRLNEAWADYEEPVLGPILICCDGNLTHMNITNANYLIHFSMPPLFSLFCKRFSVLNENYASIFGPEKEDIKIKILLDETNVEQLPKILHFVKRCTKEAFPNLDNVLQEVLVAKDLKKAENLAPICNNLLMLGDCVDPWTCQERHTVFKEYDEPRDWMPQQGLITFKISHYDSAVTYSARVLANITKSGPLKYPNNYNTLSIKMGMHYSKEVNRKLHGIPKVGDVCAVSIKQNYFERCRVLQVIPSDKKNTNHVLINLIDEEQMTTISDVFLYYLPDDLKAIETHVVKVRLANIQPKDKDVTFSLAAKDQLQQVTDHNREHGLYMRGQVVMTLGNTIFVDTAEACLDLSSLSETVVKRDFKQELLDRHAEPNLHHIEKIKKLAGITDATDVNEIKDAPKVKKSPKWAHLDKDQFSTVMLAAVVDAGTIFLRQAKFKKVIDSLLKDVKEYVENAPEIDPNEINVGNIVLAEFPGDATYERARIDEIINDKIVNCFFVDNGDWKQVSVNKLKPIPENIVHRVPFQAIECRLVGVKPPGNADAWPEFSMCWLYDNCFDDKDGNQKQLFAKYFIKEAAKVTGGHKYAVVLFDTYSEKDVVINKMMIELNLAKVIKDEEKYIDEPLDIKRVNVTDSSSDVSDEYVSEKDNSAIDVENQVVKDLVPVQPTENEASENNNISLHILLGKPIRSVPSVNSDSESDISDKWDVNVDKDLLGMFGQPSKANIAEHKDIKEDNDTTNSTNENNNTLPDKTETELEGNIASDLGTNEKNKEFSINTSVASTVKTENDKQTSLDSDDIDINDKRITALNVFRRKISREEIPETIKTEKEIAKTKNDTLDSDDLSSVATETSVTKLTAEVDPPRKPKLVWRQNKHTVVIKINLIGVEDYILEIKERDIKFQTWHNDTNYEFELQLYGVIVPNKCVQSNKGQYIQVRLIKMLTRNWLSLTKGFATKKWIVYDVDAIEFTSDEEEDNVEEARKVIKHNYQKNDSSSEEDFAYDML